MWFYVGPEKVRQTCRGPVFSICTVWSILFILILVYRAVMSPVTSRHSGSILVLRIFKIAFVLRSEGMKE